MNQDQIEKLIELIERIYLKSSRGFPEGFDVNAVLIALKGYSFMTDAHNYLDITTVPKDHTYVQLLVCNPDSPLADISEEDLHWTTGHCGFDHDEDPNFHVVGWTWSHDEFVHCVLPPDRVFGWRPFQIETTLKVSDVR